MTQAQRHIDIRASVPTDYLPRLIGFSDAATKVTERIADVSLKLTNSLYWTEKIEGTNRIVERVTADLATIQTRLGEIVSLPAGWLDGDGLPVDRRIARVAEAVSRYLLFRTVPRPRVYPTPEGGVQMEWTLGPREISLTVRADESIYGLRVNLATGEAFEAQFDTFAIAPVAELVLESPDA